MCVFSQKKSVLKNIHSYLPYLFENGYEVKCTDFKQYGMTLWALVLESPFCLIHIFQYLNEINLLFAPRNALVITENSFYLRDQISIQAMVFFLSNGEKIVGTFEKGFYENKKSQYLLYDNLLKKFHNKIFPFFSAIEFYEHKDELNQAESELNKYIYKRYIIDHHPKEKYEPENYYIK